MQPITVTDITHQLQMLPSEKLIVVYDFVAYLLERSQQTDNETWQTMLATEAVLQQDWTQPEEDTAWVDL